MSVVTQEDLRRLRQQTGGPYVDKGVLYEHGNQRVLQPHEIADAQKYEHDYWANGNVPSPTQAAVAGTSIARPNTAPKGGPAGAIYSQTQSSISGVPKVAPSVYTGFTPKYAMEGFNFDREQNTGKSAKDAFAYLSNQAPAPPLHDKVALAEWFNTYIKPGMDQLGHTVSSVEGDKFRFSNWQGTYDVDYGRGAGAQGGALAWQATDPNAPGVSAQQAAILGVPRRTVSDTMPISGVPTEYGQTPEAQDQLANYYAYLQQFLTNPQQESL